MEEACSGGGNGRQAGQATEAAGWDRQPASQALAGPGQEELPTSSWRRSPTGEARIWRNGCGEHSQSRQRKRRRGDTLSGRRRAALFHLGVSPRPRTGAVAGLGRRNAGWRQRHRIGRPAKPYCIWLPIDHCFPTDKLTVTASRATGRARGDDWRSTISRRSQRFM